MIRIVIENIVLFLMPALIYVAYHLLMGDKPAGGGRRPSAQNVIDDAPLMWLFAAGAILVIVTLVAFGSNTGGKPGQHYEPPAMKDGHIQPGHQE